ncbi:hypothetical protein MKW98_013855, partial [Papaver atlanticum]
YEAPNLRNLADKVAAAGYYVVVQYFFHGDPYTPGKDAGVWFQSHEMDKGVVEAKQVIKPLQYKGISAVGAAGMCWGAIQCCCAAILSRASAGRYSRSVLMTHGRVEGLQTCLVALLLRWFKSAGETYIKVIVLGVISYLTLAVSSFCITFDVVWAVYRRVNFVLPGLAKTSL